jgi:hypothetical protein
VKGLAFAADGKTLAAASEDKTLILWNLEQSVELDKVVAVGCDWVRDYLLTNAQLAQALAQRVRKSLAICAIAKALLGVSLALLPYLYDRSPQQTVYCTLRDC